MLAILDENHNTRTELAATRNGSHLMLNNPGGKARLEAQVIINDASLFLRNADDIPVALMESSMSSVKGGPNLILNDPKGKTLWRAIK